MSSLLLLLTLVTGRLYNICPSWIQGAASPPPSPFNARCLSDITLDCHIGYQYAESQILGCNLNKAWAILLQAKRYKYWQNSWIEYEIKWIKYERSTKHMYLGSFHLIRKWLEFHLEFYFNKGTWQELCVVDQ